MSDTSDADAPVRATVPMPVQVSLSMGRGDGPSTLDYILIIGALLLVGYGLWGLMHGKVDQANLPTIASLLSFLTGTILGGYAGYRWGASSSMKRSGVSQAGAE